MCTRGVGRHRFHEGDLGRAEDDIGRVGRLSDMCFGLGLSTQVFVLCRPTPDEWP